MYELDKASLSSRQVVLHQPSTIALLLFLAAFFLLPGLPLLGWGLAGAPGANVNEDGPNVQLLVLGFGGLMVLVAALLLTPLLPSRRRLLPERLVFDGARHCLSVVERGQGGEQVGEIPYSDIAGFEVNRVVSHSSKRSYTRYWVSMAKKDGAAWKLLSFDSESEAESCRKELESRINVGEAPEARPRIPTSGIFEVSEEGARTSISWVPTADRLVGLIIIPLVASAGLVFYGGCQAAPEWQPWIAGVTLFVIALIVRGTLRGPKRQQIVVSPTELVLHNGKRHTTIPSADIDCVVFNFCTERDDSSLYILRTGERQVLEPLWHGQASVGDVFAVFKMARDAALADLSRLSAVEKLELESLVQKAIERQSGRKVA